MPAPAYPYVVTAHLLLATAAVGLGAVALASAKGARRHRRTGRGYLRAVAGVAATGAALAVLGRPSLRLAALLLLTAYPTWSGVRVLGRKRPDVDPAHRATRADHSAALGTVVAAVAVMAANARGLGGVHTGPIWGFAGFVAAMAAYDLRRFARPAAWPMRPTLWLREHVGKSTGAYFGAVSAFSGSVFTAVPDPWRVLVPNLVGVAVIAVYLRRLRGGRLGHVPHAPRRVPAGAQAAASVAPEALAGRAA